MNTEQQEIIDYFANNLIENTLYTIGGVPNSGESFILKELIKKYFKEGKDVVVVLSLISLEGLILKQDITKLNSHSFSLAEPINLPNGTITVIELSIGETLTNLGHLINTYTSHLNLLKQIIFIESINILCGHKQGTYQLLDDLSKIFIKCPVIATFQIPSNISNVSSKSLFLTKF